MWHVVYQCKSGPYLSCGLLALPFGEGDDPVIRRKQPGSTPACLLAVSGPIPSGTPGQSRGGGVLHMGLQVQIVHQFVKVGGAASTPMKKKWYNTTPTAAPPTFAAAPPTPTAAPPTSAAAPPTPTAAPPTPTGALPTFLQSSTREQVASSSRGCSVVEPTRLCCQWPESKLHRLRATP